MRRSVDGDKLAVPREDRDGWVGAAHLLLRLNLRGLKTRCPRCGQIGLPMSKWVPGQSEKPLCFIHSNNGGPPVQCDLVKEEADRLRGAVDLSKADLKQLLRGTKAYVLFSGGMDSLCVLAYLREISDGLGTELTALHVDTTAGFPEVTEYVRTVCKRLRVPLQVVKPKNDYFELAKRWGIPNHTARWCCKELKVKPARDFLRRIPGTKVVFDGIRAAESAQRSKYLPVWYHPAFRCISVSPILGWSHDQVQSYVRAQRLPRSPALDFGCSAECWCGAYKKRSDFERLLEVHPEIFDKLVEVERAQKGRFTFLYEDGKQVKLGKLRKRSSKPMGDRRRTVVRNRDCKAPGTGRHEANGR